MKASTKWLLGIVVGLIIIAGAALYFYFFGTLFWSKYENKDLNFSVRYPKNWAMEIGQEESFGNSFYATLHPKATGVNYYIGISHTYLDEDNKGIDSQFSTLTSNCSEDCTVLPSLKAIKSQGSNYGQEIDMYDFATGKVIIGFTYTYNNEDYKNKFEQDKSVFNKIAGSFRTLKPIAASSTTTPTTDLKTYTNSQYGFSFQYPSTWQEDAAGAPDKNAIFQIKFTDPARLTEIETANCLISELNKWDLPKYTENYCQTKIAGLSQAQKDAKMQLTHEKDVTTVIYKNDGSTNLKDWLEKYYRTFGGELANFSATNKISLGGEDGYVIQTACCADYYLKYTAFYKNYIYELGTNYADGDHNNLSNTLLSQIAQTFEFTP